MQIKKIAHVQAHAWRSLQYKHTHICHFLPFSDNVYLSNKPNIDLCYKIYECYGNNTTLKLKFYTFLSSFVTHTATHGKPSLVHLQARQPRVDLHPHLISSVHAFAASGRVIHTGFQHPLLQVHPHPYPTLTQLCQLST